MTWKQNVFSSHVASVGYDEATNDLLVEWKNGKTSAYAGVPEDLAQQVANAPSVGQMIHGLIKNNYPHRYV
jgi:KTSC domain